MKNNKVRLLTASALVLALTLSAGAWRNDDSVYANGSTSLSATADTGAGGDDAGHSKKGRHPAQGGFKLFSDERVAASLGMSTDALAASLQADKSLAELANERGIDAAMVQSVIQAALKEKLDEKLAAGKLTQEQYDKQADRLGDFAALLLNSKHGGSRAAVKAELKSEHSAEREVAKAERKAAREASKNEA